MQSFKRARGALLALLTPACFSSSSGGMDLPVQEFAGHLTVDERGNWFVPCESSSRTPMWVTFTEGSVTQFNDARASGVIRNGAQTYVEIRAALTDERHVGPGGPALLVRHISEARAAATTDCADR